MTITEEGVITPESPEDKYMCGTLAYSVSQSEVWPFTVRRAASGEADALLDALELYEDLERDLIHPASEYDDLRDHPEAKHAALVRAAQAVQDLTGELVRVFPACEVRFEGREAA